MVRHCFASTPSNLHCVKHMDKSSKQMAHSGAYPPENLPIINLSKKYADISRIHQATHTHIQHASHGVQTIAKSTTATVWPASDIWQMICVPGRANCPKSPRDLLMSYLHAAHCIPCHGHSTASAHWHAAHCVPAYCCPGQHNFDCQHYCQCKPQVNSYRQQHGYSCFHLPGWLGSCSLCCLQPPVHH